METNYLASQRAARTGYVIAVIAGIWLGIAVAWWAGILAAVIAWFVGTFVAKQFWSWLEWMTLRNR